MMKLVKIHFRRKNYCGGHAIRSRWIYCLDSRVFTEIGVSAPEVPCQIVGMINLFFMHFALCSKLLYILIVVRRRNPSGLGFVNKAQRIDDAHCSFFEEGCTPKNS